MEWFYDLLDIEKGMDMAASDARQVRTPQAASFLIVINLVLGVALAGLWLRYDLWSTMHFFEPWRTNIMESVPETGKIWPLVKSAMGFIIGIAVAFATSFIQWSYPRMARAHKAAFWVLAASSIFDMYTDRVDVQADFPTYATGLLDLVSAQTADRWLMVVILAGAAAIFLKHQRPALILLAVISLASLISPALDITVRDVWQYSIVYLGTLFCSFIAQTMVVVHAVKVIALAGRMKALGVAARLAEMER